MAARNRVPKPKKEQQVTTPEPPAAPVAAPEPPAVYLAAAPEPPAAAPVPEHPKTREVGPDDGRRRVKKQFTAVTAVPEIDKIKRSIKTPDQVRKELAKEAEGLEARAEAAAQAVRDAFAKKLEQDIESACAAANKAAHARAKAILAQLSESEVELVVKLTEYQPPAQ